MCVYDCHKEALPVSLYGSVSYYLQIVDYSGFTTTIKQFVLHSKEDPQPAAAPWRFDFHNALERRNLLRLYWSWILTGGKRCKVFPQGVTTGYTASLSKNKGGSSSLWWPFEKHPSFTDASQKEFKQVHSSKWWFFFCFKLKFPHTAPLINACDAYHVLIDTIIDVLTKYVFVGIEDTVSYGVVLYSAPLININKLIIM